MPPRLLALIVLVSSPLSPAAAPTSDQGRALAATCLTCHGPGQGRAPWAPPLEGMTRSRLTDTLRAYRAEPQGGAVMRQLARGYTDAEIAALADWFAAQPRAAGVKPAAR